MGFGDAGVSQKETVSNPRMSLKKDGPQLCAALTLRIFPLLCPYRLRAFRRSLAVRQILGSRKIDA